MLNIKVKLMFFDLLTMSYFAVQSQVLFFESMLVIIGLLCNIAILQYITSSTTFAECNKPNSLHLLRKSVIAYYTVPRLKGTLWAI